MPQITDSRDVYRQLVEESDKDWLYGLLAFAVIEEQRIEWMEHFEQTRGAAPSAEDIADWYRQQPEGALLRAVGTAETALVAYAKKSAKDALQGERQSMLEGAVIAEIRKIGRFGPQLGVNALGGFIGALGFAILVLVLGLVFVTDFSVVDLVKNFFEFQQED